jgi:hypothetical protein
MLTRILCTLFVAAIFTVACVSHGPWQERNNPAPWVAVGKPAKLYIRAVYPGPFIVAGDTSEAVWQDDRGNRFALSRYQDRIERFMIKTEMMKHWQDSNSANDRGTYKLAPYRLTLLSINPMVLVMTPFDFGSIKGRSESMILEPTRGRRCLGSHYVINDLECGTSAPFGNAMLWFSPDLDVAPTAIVWRAGRATIELRSREVLSLSREELIVQSRREFHP